jgi:hypothetical protein
MAEQGGLSTRQKIYVTELPESVSKISIKIYDPMTLENIYTDMSLNGFSIIIMPGSSKTHLEFALQAPHYQGFGHSPLIGWVSGVHLDDLGRIKPKVFNSRTQTLEDGAVVMHAALPSSQVAEIGFLNIFEQGNDDTITFPKDGFSVQDILMGQIFADYVTRGSYKRLRLSPLLRAMVNVSFLRWIQRIKFEFYAPVLPVSYNEPAI